MPCHDEEYEEGAATAVREEKGSCDSDQRERESMRGRMQVLSSVGAAIVR